MNRRNNLVAAAALAAVTALIGAAAPSGAAPSGIPSGSSTTDEAGDVTGKSIDLTKVALNVQPSGNYRAVLSFADLKKTTSTRRVLDISTFSLGLRKQAEAADKLASTTTSVDYRTSPGGRTSVKLWSAGFLGDATQVACPGLKAQANNATNKLYLTIPADCFPGSTLIPPSVSARAWKVPAGSWDGTTLTVPEGSNLDSTGSFLFAPIA